MKKIFIILLLVTLLPGSALAWYRDVKVKSVTLNVDTNIYAAKDSIGGLQTLSTAVCGPIQHGHITAVQLTDKSDNAVEYDVVLFKSSPAGTFTDQAPVDPADADLSLMLPVINLASTDHFSFNDNGISSLASLTSQVFSASTGTTPGTLYFVLVSRGTPTYAASGDVTVTFYIACD